MPRLMGISMTEGVNRVSLCGHNHTDCFFSEMSTCHPLHRNVERVSCVSSEKGWIYLLISVPQEIVEL